MKKPNINIIHYMSKTADLGYEGEIQSLIIEFVVAAISVILTVYGYLYQWDLLIPIFILPAILGSFAFCHSLYLLVSNSFAKGSDSENDQNH